ncbi:uncharacterized protein EI97DRAFT_374761 [Westerdykella ornata]|uniref:C2H2-type domain-containing protein n=1 Tax=Westerdykella ornata TaxID=318751 RepID=A0A6A6JMR4_WESOR|nr:uncharacterized protein EI97DRAFT_374761 [Westerdykella ornata]KAF2277524.1 hypothetical protein EI97DRAFT_374761 [Westerdykella ornata]
MSVHQTHPRRRPFKPTDPTVPSLSTHAMQLRKSGTFSSPKSISSDLCDLDNHRYMPRRSPTSTESLEELMNDAGVQRVAKFLKDFEKKLAGHKSSAASILNDPEVLPVPSFMLDNTSIDGTPMEIDCKPTVADQNPHEHASDSGLGTSLHDSKLGKLHMSPSNPPTPRSNTYKGDSRSVSTSAISSHSAVTQSFSAQSALEEKHTLGEHACKQIHDLIIKPILAEESLKDFHPLINDVPRRIGNKNICNLRDLEKTLIFLAPEFSATPASYLRFCEQSIQLLHATVDHLSEQDQRLPTDRPYTNNYFLDLIEQIRRYAAIMAATRQKEENGEELDEMDYSRDEKITLRGGLTHNGRPVEIVRIKNGKTIPVVEGADQVDTGFAASKRALSDADMDDESVTRSMARRRKSEKPGDVEHVCRECDKVFKRPCDLTKHEKTHSRPWKCTEEKCKYFELGWPTEKERDRHVNDKHSAAPPQFKCKYPPCEYKSKRESNCKQHMEKAHGWTYVRSKSNGRKKAPTVSSSTQSPPTPVSPFQSTPMSAFPTPVTPFMVSPTMPLMQDSVYSYDFGKPALSSNDHLGDYRRDSATTTDGSNFTYSSRHSSFEPTAFENALTPEETMLNHGDLFNGMNGNFNNIVQQPTPSWGVAQFDDWSFPMNTTATINQPNMTNTSTSNTLSAVAPQLSPTAQAHVTLYNPSVNVDEGFMEDSFTFDLPGTDFTLFENMQPAGMTEASSANFFQDINQFTSQYDDSLYAGPNDGINLDDLMDSSHQQ